MRSLLDSVPLPSLENLKLGELNFVPDLVRNLDQVLHKFDILSSIENIRRQVDALDTEILCQISGAASQLESTILGPDALSSGSATTLKLVFQKVSLLLEPLSLSPTTAILVSAALSYLCINALLTWGQPPPPSQPYPLKKYDPIAARAYFDERLPMVLARGLQILAQSLQFGFDLLKDKLKYVHNAPTASTVL